MWLEKDKKVFGDGPLEMLRLIDELGSLRRAAQKMGMSYSQAWNLVVKLEKSLGYPLLQRSVGGEAGGGSSLTEEARSLMNRYAAFRDEADKSLTDLFSKFFGDLSEK